MYVSSLTSIIKLTPPITSASTPAANVTQYPDNYGLLVDASNNVYVANATVDGTIDIFHQPFQNGSKRAFGLFVTVFADWIVGMAFDKSGNLWCTTASRYVWEIPAPITPTSNAKQILNVEPFGPYAEAIGIAFGP
jgi:hypothetical protein